MLICLRLFIQIDPFVFKRALAMHGIIRDIRMIMMAMVANNSIRVKGVCIFLINKIPRYQHLE